MSNLLDPGVSTQGNIKYSEKDIIRVINLFVKLMTLKDYFQVIILSPQIMELLIYEMDECGNRYIARKMGEPSDEELEVQKLYKQVLKEESIKARVVSYLVNLYENDYDFVSFSKKDFVKYFTKLESVIVCRNQLAHEYYKKHISNQKMKRAAKEGIEIIELLACHPSLHF